MRACWLNTIKTGRFIRFQTCMQLHHGYMRLWPVALPRDYCFDAGWVEAACFESDPVNLITNKQLNPFVKFVKFVKAPRWIFMG